ncbi:DinB superfamily protein [mine drainage metagenome]|uniref:DinB superfamily protein n=1 Tax=mine drainage metagenome TaxID=410659 RepID=A0A1J5SH74_9ZZZZ
MSFEKDFLQNTIKRFKNYKDLGDKTFAQLNEADFFYQPNEASNSIAIIIQHLYGNMMSRWTNFLTEDGEKHWRKRDAEFAVMKCSKADLISFWNAGWDCLLTALESLTEEDLGKTIYIRTEPLNVVDAILRQLVHYASHVGQIIYVGRLIKNENWQSLSIPKTTGASEKYNEDVKQGIKKQP